MLAVVLAATHEERVNTHGISVPMPLIDLIEGEPYLTTLVRRMADLPQLRALYIVTNEKIKPQLDAWLAHAPSVGFPIQVLGDGTWTPEERKGAVGDLVFAIQEAQIADDVLVLGGDNWFTFALEEFVARARQASPAVLMTPIVGVPRPSRFGWAHLDDQNRIVEFLEHPGQAVPDRMLKASCVYFLSASQLQWFEEFARERSLVCSPGVFFAWLAAQTPVFGVPMIGTIYDMAGPRLLKGPDLLEFRDNLRRTIDLAYATWEKQAGQALQWATSHEDLIEALRDKESNKRIIAARLLGQAERLLDRESKTQVIQALLPLLADRAMNDLEYGGRQDDEESLNYVSATAAEALAMLGFAPTAAEVFEEAKRQGLPVCVRENR